VNLNFVIFFGLHSVKFENGSGIHYSKSTAPEKMKKIAKIIFLPRREFMRLLAAARRNELQ
jgi:hypothetical protein